MDVSYMPPRDVYCAPSYEYQSKRHVFCMPKPNSTRNCCALGRRWHYRIPKRTVFVCCSQGPLWVSMHCAFNQTLPTEHRHDSTSATLVGQLPRAMQV